MTAPNVHASIPFVPETGRYRLGLGLEATPLDWWWNTTFEDGTHTVCEEPEGWEGLEYVTPVDTSGGQDGGLIGPQSIAPRILSVRGLMVAPDPRTLRQQIRRLRSILSVRSLVVWDQYDFGEGVRMGLVCAPFGDLAPTPIMGGHPGGVAAPIEFDLIAANPVWKVATDGGDAPLEIGLPTGEVTGRTYDKTYDYDYGAVVQPGGSGVAFNRGDREAWPVFEIVGPVPAPIISNDTTGRMFALNQDVPAGETVTIDSRTGLITPSSYSTVGRAFPLAPGANTIRWRSGTGVYEPDALLRVTWRSTWG